MSKWEPGHILSLGVYDIYDQAVRRAVEFMSEDAMGSRNKNIITTPLCPLEADSGYGFIYYLEANGHHVEFKNHLYILENPSSVK